MKYILMMSVPNGGSYQHATWAKEDFQAHMAFMKALNNRLRGSRELVTVQALTAPDQAILVRAGAFRSATTCSHRPRDSRANSD